MATLGTEAEAKDFGATKLQEGWQQSLSCIQQLKPTAESLCAH